MSGKRKIAYPIDLKFKVGKPKCWNEATYVYKDHRELIDSIIDSLSGEFHVGYVKRDKRLVHGINAYSLNEAIRSKLTKIEGIEDEVDIVSGIIIPTSHPKGEFDFALYNRISSFNSLWKLWYGKDSELKDGDKEFNKYIKSEKVKAEWDKFVRDYNLKRNETKEIPDDNTINILGEIQFGNWSMVYKDMFRLVSAINRKAQINLYIYITASGNLKKLMSDGVVGFEDACRRFDENVENHSINKPVMIFPLDIDFDLDTYDFSEAQKGYERICSEITKLEENIESKKKELKKLRTDKKNLKGSKLEEITNTIKEVLEEKTKLEKMLSELKNEYKEHDEFDQE